MTTKPDERTETKSVLLRFPISTYRSLVQEAGRETTKRGESVSVPKLVLEIVRGWLDARSGK
jgi:hypothetical protein